jgi:secreted PhoX family phosphatase
VSVTDTASGNASRILSQRADWERLDGLVWTPAGTLLAGENVRVQERPDSGAASAKAGLVYEINPRTGVPTVRPALGAFAHKGMSFDHLGNLYAVSATTPGYVYRFVPTVANNYSAGTLSALWISPTGESMWLALPAADVAVDADAAAKAAGATVLLNPEDAKVMIITSPSGAKRSQLFVSETGANRVLTVVLRTAVSGTTPVADNTAFTSTYVAPGVNAGKDFSAPSALMIDTTYNLYIAEHNGGGGAATKTAGDDIWVAPANGLSAIVAMPVGRLASVTDCDATPAGLMFDLTGSKLFLNLTGRGGDGRDMTVLITTAGGV